MHDLHFADFLRPYFIFSERTSHKRWMRESVGISINSKLLYATNYNRKNTNNTLQNQPILNSYKKIHTRTAPNHIHFVNKTISTRNKLGAFQK